jgi:hypothetical protein
LTHFNKGQLQLLLIHWRIPAVIVTQQRHRFSGEELLIVCSSKIATGDPWTCLIPGYFGGDVRRWSEAFRWFINHLFCNFYHKISGESIELWLGQMIFFKQAILNHLAQHAHPIERKLFVEEGHPERALYVIQ